MYSNRQYLSDTYQLFSVYKQRLVHGVLNRVKAHENVKKTQRRLRPKDAVGWKSDPIRMIEENYFRAWAKIFILRPVLPFDHHPHAWSMA